MSFRRDIFISTVLSGVLLCLFFNCLRPVEAKTVARPTSLSSYLASEMYVAGSAPLALGAESQAQAAPASAPAIPDGKGKDVTLRVCTTCHAATQWSGLHHTRQEWSAIIDDMVSKGLEASGDELSTVNDYLATNMGPAKTDAPPQ